MDLNIIKNFVNNNFALFLGLQILSVIIVIYLNIRLIGIIKSKYPLLYKALDKPSPFVRNQPKYARFMFSMKPLQIGDKEITRIILVLYFFFCFIVLWAMIIFISIK